MQSALNAKAILEEEYPESQIYVCDSCVNTVLQGIYVPVSYTHLDVYKRQLVPMLTGLDVSTTLLFAGLGTLLFHLLTKRKVPAFLGSSRCV